MFVLTKMIILQRLVNVVHISNLKELKREFTINMQKNLLKRAMLIIVSVVRKDLMTLKINKKLMERFQDMTDFAEVLVLKMLKRELQMAKIMLLD